MTADALMVLAAKISELARQIEIARHALRTIAETPHDYGNSDAAYMAQCARTALVLLP